MVDISPNKSIFKTRYTDTHTCDNHNLIEEAKSYSKTQQTSLSNISECSLHPSKNESAQYYVTVQCNKVVYQSLSKDVWVTYSTIPVVKKI